jgi:hypothetical protein
LWALPKQVKLAREMLPTEAKRQTALRDQFIQAVLDAVPDAF